MNYFGRAIFVGAISEYNATNPKKGKFLVTRYILRFLSYPELGIITDVSKYKIRNQGVHENYICWILIILYELIFNGTAKTKLEMLAFRCLESL